MAESHEDCGGVSEVLVVDRLADGVAFSVKAHPGARRQGIAGVRNGALRVEVTAAPERGKANKAILKVLAKALDLPLANLDILTGGTSSLKRVSANGLTVAEARARLVRTWKGNA